MVSESLPVAVEGNEDVLGKMTGLLRDGTMAWQTLLPERFGEATVSVRLEEVSGDLLIGRQINVNVRNEFRTRLRRLVTVSAQLLGSLVIALGTVLELLEIFNVKQVSQAIGLKCKTTTQWYVGFERPSRRTP